MVVHLQTAACWGHSKGIAVPEVQDSPSVPCPAMAQQFWASCLSTLFLAALAQESLGPQKAKVSNSPHPARDLNRFQHLISNGATKRFRILLLKGESCLTAFLCRLLPLRPSATAPCLPLFTVLYCVFLVYLLCFSALCGSLSYPFPSSLGHSPFDGCLTIRICSIPGPGLGKGDFSSVTIKTQRLMGGRRTASSAQCKDFSDLGAAPEKGSHCGAVAKSPHKEPERETSIQKYPHGESVSIPVFFFKKNSCMHLRRQNWASGTETYIS